MLETIDVETGPTPTAAIIWLLGFFLAREAYFIGFELRPNGATPGKRALGLRVRIEDKHGRGRVIIEYGKLEGFDALLESLEQIFRAIADKDIDAIVRLTNTNPAFISAWGMPTHFLVLRKRFASQQALPR